MATSTSPISGERTSCSQLVEAFFQPQLAAKAAGFSSGWPKTVCMTGVSGGLKNLATCPQAFECDRPMNPCPIKATLIVAMSQCLPDGFGS